MPGLGRLVRRLTSFRRGRRTPTLAAMATSGVLDIPLFPLNTVLFPGGMLNLRVFERRYLDLVRDCARTGSGFGVCLILHGREVGEAAVPAAIGTLAHIVDFYTQPDGLLGICVNGGRRFHVHSSRVRDNGLAHGAVEFLPDEPAVAIPVQYQLLATILERQLEKSGNAHG